MHSIPSRLLDDCAAERMNERRRSCPDATMFPRTPAGRHRAALALRRLADRLDSRAS